MTNKIWNDIDNQLAHPIFQIQQNNIWNQLLNSVDVFTIEKIRSEYLIPVKIEINNEIVDLLRNQIGWQIYSEQKSYREK